MMSTAAPEHNTISLTQQAETPLCIRKRAHTLITRMSNKKRTGKASKVETTIAQLVKNVHQALAVMDTDTGKLLNYRQLMRNAKYKKNWSTSSANEFGRLASGFGGGKKPKQHNHIHHKKVHTKQLQERSDLQKIHMQRLTREKIKE